MRSMGIDFERHLGAVELSVSSLERDGQPARGVTLSRSYTTTKERVIDLLRRVCTVSVATMEIVDSMAHRELGERRGQAPGHGV